MQFEELRTKLSKAKAELFECRAKIKVCDVCVYVNLYQGLYMKVFVGSTTHMKACAVHVCMYVCMCLCIMYVCMYVCVYVCMY